jgi:carbamoyltransferase
MGGIAGGARVHLGIADSHDAGVAIVVDGHLVAAVGEERFDRRKMSAGTPVRSLAYLFERAGVDPAAIATVTLAGKSRVGAMPSNNDFSDEAGRHSRLMGVAEALHGTPMGPAAMRMSASHRAYLGAIGRLGGGRLARIAAILQRHGVRAPLRVVEHHNAHAASAYFAARLDEALIFTNDGFGDGTAAKVMVGRAGSLSELARTSFIDSLGVLYNYATLLCGFPKSHHAGKTTGLAAYGDPRQTIDVFRGLADWDQATGRYRNGGPIFRRAIDALSVGLGGASREDIAAGVQALVEEILVAQARHWQARTGIRALALAGGVHANVKANQRIVEQAGPTSFFVFPNMGDGGLAAGAAWMGWADDVGPAARPRADAVADVYLGPTITPVAARAALIGAGLAFEEPVAMAEAVAEHLAAGKIVARAAGPMEFGPRALGNRSILYGASDASVNGWLNRQLRRTEFMPFAPVVRAEDGDAFFVGLSDVNRRAAAFMTITVDVTDRCRREAPAVVHVDGTARPQILERAVNPEYHDILTAYARLTGLRVLVNTSFNMHEEPIVCDAEDAVRAFIASEIDVLQLGPCLAVAPNSGAARKGGVSERGQT